MRILRDTNVQVIGINAFIKAVNGSIAYTAVYLNRLLDNPVTCEDADISIIDSGIEMTELLIKMGALEYEDPGISSELLSSWTHILQMLKGNLKTLKEYSKIKNSEQQIQSTEQIKNTSASEN